MITKNTRADSPITGLIFILGVILALGALTATVVFLIAGQTSGSQPSVDPGFEYNSSGGVLMITHNGGDQLDKSNTAELEVRVDGSVNSSNVAGSGPYTFGEQGSSSAPITKGELLANATNKYYSRGDTVTIYWTSGDEIVTEKLGEYTIPTTASGANNSDQSGNDETNSTLPLPEPSISVSPKTSGDPTTVFTFDASDTVVPENNSVTAYQWDFGDGTTKIGQTVTHSYAKVGSYNVTLTVTDSNGDNNTTTELIYIGDPQASYTQSSSVVYKNDSITFDASGSTGENLSYEWTTSESITGFPQSGQTITTNFSSPYRLELILTVTDEYGNKDSTAKQINVFNRQPTAQFSVTPKSGETDTVFSFTANGSFDPDHDPLSYQWDFADGTTATGPSLTNQYSSPGNYTVTLVVTDTEGSTDTTKQHITVRQEDSESSTVGARQLSANEAKISAITAE